MISKLLRLYGYWKGFLLACVVGFCSGFRRHIKLLSNEKEEKTPLNIINIPMKVARGKCKTTLGLVLDRLLPTFQEKKVFFT